MQEQQQIELAKLLDTILETEVTRGNPAAVSKEIDWLVDLIAKKIDGGMLIDLVKKKLIRVALVKGWEAIPAKFDPYAIAALKTAFDYFSGKNGKVISRGKRLAVLSNVSHIDPEVYGNDGHLPGVELDRANWRTFLQQQGFKIVVDTPDMRRNQFARAIADVAKEAAPGDVVVIQHSGHGSQQRDDNGDESDGQDEVLCLFDGTLTDDKVFGLLSLFQNDVHVVLITDTCHSGTMYRSMLIDRVAKPSGELNCNLVAIGTCSDKQTSADTSDGGAGSRALLSTFGSSTSYAAWVTQSQAWLRSNRFRQTMSLNVVNADASGAIFDGVAPIDPGASGGTSGIASVVVTFADGRIVRL